jgi:uncharacterized protein
VLFSIPLSVCLLAVLAVLQWRFIRKDRAEYVAFKQLESSDERQRYFKRWIVRSLSGFGVVTLVVLLSSNRISWLVSPPLELLAVRRSLSLSSPESTNFDWSILLAVALGLLASLVVVAVVNVIRGQRNPLMVGDIEALLPRDAKEGCWVVLMSINAGVSEELYFRLLVPSLLLVITRDPLLAFALASLNFALMHAYQGLFGVLATGVLGAMLALVYVWSGQLWVAMAVHAALDLRTLVLLPAIQAVTRRVARILPAGDPAP